MTRWTMAAAAAGLMAAGSARAGGTYRAAADVKVADDAWSGGARFSGMGWGTSAELGRAWLVLHFEHAGPCPASDGECEVDSPLPVAVDGLSYDAAASRIVYRGAGAEPVVCAIVRPHGGFLGVGDAVAATGLCTVQPVRVERVVDDGFAGGRERRDELHFAVRSADLAARPEAVERAEPGTPATYGARDTGYGAEGAGAGDPASPSDVAGRATRGAKASAAERAAREDAEQVAAGNTGGRG